MIAMRTLVSNLCLSLLLLSTQVNGQTNTPRDIDIDGQTYSLISATELLDSLRRAPSTAQLEYRDIAVDGPLFSPTADLDTVRASLTFANVVFLKEVSFNGIVFNAETRFEKVQFNGGLSALGARFNGDLTLSQSTSRKHTSFKKAVFAGAADFSNNQFKQTTSFIEAHFAATSFANTHFAADTYFERANFGKDADFRDAFFEGIAAFKETQWHGATYFGGARFQQRTRFWQARFDGPVDFDNARSRGEISFKQAVFAGPTTFRHITFVHPARFTRATFRQSVSFADSRFKKAAEFTGARFEADLDLNAYFKSVLDLRYSRGPSLNLLPPFGERATVNPDSTFTDTARVYLQRANFEHMLFRWQQLAGRLASKDSTGHDLGFVYDGLRHHLASKGLSTDARVCFAASMDHRLQTLNWREAEWHWLQLLRLSTRYGTDIGRLALFAVGSILVFALLYRIFGLPPSFSGYLYFSLLTFLRAGPPAGSAGARISRMLIVAQMLLGWLCLGLFLLTLLTSF
jgi:hypothetical protein